MLKRISGLQRPVLKNDEEYQRVQMVGTSQLLKEMLMAAIKAANKLGALDHSVYEWSDEAQAEVISKAFFRAMEEETEKEAGEISRTLCSGMQSSAVNYAGLVLTGKMKPIYDGSLDDEAERKRTRKSAESIISDAGLELAKLGALRETEDGRMVLSEQNRLFDTIKGNYYGKGSTKRKVKQCVKRTKQPSERKRTS